MILCNNQNDDDAQRKPQLLQKTIDWGNYQSENDMLTLENVETYIYFKIKDSSISNRFMRVKAKLSLISQSIIVSTRHWDCKWRKTVLNKAFNLTYRWATYSMSANRRRHLRLRYCYRNNFDGLSGIWKSEVSLAWFFSERRKQRW
jgi:hypothetical protein